MTTPKKRNERLLQVCRVLRELPKGKRFDIREWYTCGTVGCAAGWAAVDRWFNRRGLKLKMYGKGGVPIFEGLEGIGAVTEFFHLGYDEAQDLFYPVGYKKGAQGRHTVIRRIEKYVRDNPA